MRLLVPLLLSFLILAAFSTVGLTAAPTAITVKLATVAPEGSPWAAGLEQYKKLVESTSGGRLKVRVFLGGALGDENETVVACRRGQIQAMGGSTGAIASIVPELSVLELPYLFRSEKEADHILDTVVQARFDQLFKSRGLILGFWSENGYRCFGSRNKLIKSPADLAGRKMRSQENPVHIAMYRAMGASPVPIPTTEVLTSLQTGVVDGFDNTALFAFAASWHTAVKYYTVSNHIYQPAAIIFNAEFFNGLPADLQQILLSARQKIAPDLRRQIRALTPILVENLKESGIQVHVPTAQENAAFQKAGATGRTNYINSASASEKEVYNTIVAALSKYRGGK